MNMSKKCKVINVLLMNLPVAVAICIAAQLLATHTFVFKMFLINFVLSYAISFLVGMFVPAVPWGLAFANKCKAQPETLKFGLLVNVVVNLVYVVVNCLILTFFNVVILNHAPIIAFVFGVLTTFIPVYLVGYVVAFLANRPAEKIARNICNE